MSCIAYIIYIGIYVISLPLTLYGCMYTEDNDIVTSFRTTFMSTKSLGIHLLEAFVLYRGIERVQCVSEKCQPMIIHSRVTRFNIIM